MNLWETLQEFISPPISRDITLQDVREHLLNAVLRVASVLGVIVLLVNLPAMVNRHAWGNIILYTLLATWLLRISFFRGTTYNLRAGTLLVTLYIVGTISTLQYATIGDGRMWLLGLIILSAVFLGLRAGLFAALVTTSSMLLIGWLMSIDVLPVPVFENLGLPGNFSTWTNTSAAFLVISLVLLTAVTTLIANTNQAAEERERLLSTLEQEHKEAKQRTRELERRQEQLYTAAEISGVLGRVYDLDALLQSVVDLLTTRFDLYYSGVFLLDEQGLYAVLQAGSGEAGKRMREAGHRLAIGGTSMIGWCIAHRKARIALDTGTEAIRFNNPHLPLTRSELALPIMLGNDVLGALTIQSTKPNAFDQTDITILQGIANSLATAIQNARLVQRLQQSLDEVQRLNQQYLINAWQQETTGKETGFRLEVENPAAPAILPEDQTIEVPIVLRGVQIGAIQVEGAQPWDEQDIEFIRAMAAQAAQALENARLVQETLRQAQREQVATAIAEQARSSLDLETILRSSVQEIQKALRLHRVRIRLSQEETSPEAHRGV
ncbi:MAG TPA: GAF domain-containing protein [Chloroflexi bacterium]|nr:GAF domain-containing protein [Chloroflexota bacterium]